MFATGATRNVDYIVIVMKPSIAFSQVICSRRFQSRWYVLLGWYLGTYTRDVQLTLLGPYLYIYIGGKKY